MASLTDLQLNNPFAVTATTTQATTPAATAVVATVPMVPTTQTPAATTPVSATKPIQLVPTQEQKKTGLEVEKTTQTTEPQTTNKTEKTKTGAHKSKRTIDEAMRISIPNWDKLSDAEKQDKIVAQISTVKKEKFNYLATKGQPDGRIGWLKSFLLNDRMTPEESKLVVGSLKKLNVSKAEMAELQAQGVNMAFDGDNKNEESCQLQVAQDMGAYGSKAQKNAIDRTSTAKFDSVKIEGSKNASVVKTELQDYAVTKYIEGAKTSSEKVQNIIGHSIVDQYADFAKENQVRIHEIVSTKSTSEVVEYAASNIWHFDKDNQAQAVQITTNTGNEKAINAAAAQYDKYDASARAQIKETISNSGYDSAKSTLSAAEEKAQAQAKAKAETDAKVETASNEKTSSSNTLKNIIKSDSVNKGIEIREAFKAAEKAAWIDTLTPNELANMISVLPLNELSSDVLGKVLRLMGSADSKSQKEVIDRINTTSLSDVVGMQIGSLGLGMQSAYVTEMANSGKKLQSTNTLLFSVRQDYNKQLNERKMG